MDQRVQRYTSLTLITQRQKKNIPKLRAKLGQLGESDKD